MAQVDFRREENSSLNLGIIIRHQLTHNNKLTRFSEHFKYYFFQTNYKWNIYNEITLEEMLFLFFEKTIQGNLFHQDFE